MRCFFPLHHRFFSLLITAAAASAGTHSVTARGSAYCQPKSAYYAAICDQFLSCIGNFSVLGQGYFTLIAPYMFKCETFGQKHNGSVLTFKF